MTPPPPPTQRDSLQSFLLTGEYGFRSEKHVLFSSSPLTHHISFFFGSSLIHSLCCNSGFPCLDYEYSGDVDGCLMNAHVNGQHGVLFHVRAKLKAAK